MKKVLLVELIVALALAGCMVGPAGGGYGIAVVPALPSVVVLGSEPYYQHGGYFYLYEGDRWSYSNSRGGPWQVLPRDRYPREVHHKGNQGQGQDQGHDQGKKHGHERK